MEDWFLINRCKRGDAKAFERQLDRAGAVFGSRPAGQSEDILQYIETLDL
ncbi:MAG: hypothetical protein IH892_10975 [Planctomycetes bacterium]|nr:hypothetical protein [Planctomycetota bacterium]